VSQKENEFWKELPIPTLEASHYTVYEPVADGNTNTGAVVRSALSFWKLSSHSPDYTNGAPFWVNLVKGDAIEENP